MLINTDIFYQKNSNEFVQENALKEFLRRVPEINLSDADTIISLEIDDNNNLIISYLDKNKEKQTKKIVLNNEVKDPRLDDYIDGLSSGLYQGAYRAVVSPNPDKMIFPTATVGGSVVFLESRKKPFNRFLSTNAQYFIQTPITVYAQNTSGHDFTFTANSKPIFSFILKEDTYNTQQASYLNTALRLMEEIPVFLTNNATSFPTTTVLTGKIKVEPIILADSQRAQQYSCSILPPTDSSIVVKNNDVLSYSFSFMQ